jgi:hypothetical protein
MVGGRRGKQVHTPQEERRQFHFSLRERRKKRKKRKIAKEHTIH